MLFRTGSIATLLIGLSGYAVAQYYPPPQAYPRQPLPPAVNAEELPPLKAPVAQGDPLPPVGVGPASQAAAKRALSNGNRRLSNRHRTAPTRRQPRALQGSAARLRTGCHEPLLRPGRRHTTRPTRFDQAGCNSGGGDAVQAAEQPGQIGSGPTVNESLQGGDPNNVAALPAEVRPETEPNKELAPQFRRMLVEYRTKEPAGTIIVDTPNTYLYLVLGGGKALRYGIGVGREGFTWSGVERVTRMLEWPDWTPPEEMIVRQPYLPRFMAGGETNPLGARALYLGNTVYRIHGTNQPSTIGSFVSSGCIRLANEDVMDLYRRVQVGTHVVVLSGGPPARASFGRTPPCRSATHRSRLPTPITFVRYGALSRQGRLFSRTIRRAFGRP